MVFTLARETGWSRDFILWEVHFAELLQYRQCAMVAAGRWTVKPQPPAEAQLAQLFRNWHAP